MLSIPITISICTFERTNKKISYYSNAQNVAVHPKVQLKENENIDNSYYIFRSYFSKNIQNYILI